MFPTKILLATDGSELHATGGQVLVCPPPRSET
jgi:hypothetical protein